MNHIFQHFRVEERDFIVQVISWVDQVVANYAPKLTAFLDPHQVKIVESVVGQNDDVLMKTYGKFEEAERVRLLLYPPYFEPNFEDFDCVVYELRYPSKFLQLKHPDVLGALLSIGLDRGKFGDIRVNEQKIQFVVQKEVSNYVEIHLEAIHKVKVHLKEITDDASLIESVESWMDYSMTVSSLRLDVIVASSLNISREKASSLIKGGKVKVNYSIQDNGSFELKEEDLFSIRGFGRMIVQSIEGKTKKDKIRIVISKLEKNS